MSKLTTESQSNDLYKEAASIKAQYAQRSIEDMEIRGEMRRLEEKFYSLDHTYGTLNPGKSLGWGMDPL